MAETQLFTFSEAELRDQLASWSRCSHCAGGRKGELLRIVADYLRHALAYSTQSETALPVHVHQLRSAVRSQLSCLFPDFDRPPWETFEEPAGVDAVVEGSQSVGANDVVLAALSRLAQIDDCMHIGRGYYLAAPLRAIELPEGGVLLVGGLPSKDIEKVTGESVSWAGLARTSFNPSSRGLTAQGFHSWLNIPDNPLSAWLDERISEAKERALRCAVVETASFEVYAPRQQRRHPQTSRWLPATHWQYSSKDKTEWWLCRSRLAPRRFWLARAVESTAGLTYDREFSVSNKIVRRLMYAFDSLAGCCVSATVRHAKGRLRETEVTLFNWPTWEEYKLLQALAIDLTVFEGRHLPISLRTAAQWWPAVQRALLALDIKLRDEVKSSD